MNDSQPDDPSTVAARELAPHLDRLFRERGALLREGHADSDLLVEIPSTYDKESDGARIFRLPCRHVHGIPEPRVVVSGAQAAPQVHTGPVKYPELVKRTARATAAALRPGHAATIQRLLPGFELEHGAGMAAVQAAIEDSIAEDRWQSRTVPFWKASGENLTEALIAVTGVDEEIASHMIGAALHALILARQDTAPDAILRLAERAVCWDAGREWAIAAVVAAR